MIKIFIAIMLSIVIQGCGGPSVVEQLTTQFNSGKPIFCRKGNSVSVFFNDNIVVSKKTGYVIENEQAVSDINIFSLYDQCLLTSR